MRNDIWGFWPSGSYCGESVPTSFWAGKSFLFGLLASGAACGLGLLRVVLCERLNGASVLSREGPKAAFVQLVQRERNHLILGAFLMFVQVQ